MTAEIVADRGFAQALCKKLDSRRSDLESKTTKLQKAKKENPQLEQDLLVARQKFEETEEDVENKMRYILECEVCLLRISAALPVTHLSPLS